MFSWEKRRRERVCSVGRAQEETVEIGPATILRLALPALGVLAATPLYLLFDTAVVGTLGAASLAALGAGTTIYAQVTTQLTFLSYGTTARSARLFGAGKKKEAVAEGVQATWLALFVGTVLAVTIFLGAPQFTFWLSGSSEVSSAATSWLRVTAAGIPLVLIIMAGNGWLRGVQNTRLPLLFTLSGIFPGMVLVPILVGRYGLVGSAWANIVGITITSFLFIACLFRMHEGSVQPNWSIMRSQLTLGRDLILRSLSFQISFLSAAAVAGRFGPESLAAHQVLLQLWSFLTLVLDSLAIAGQMLTGAALGAKDVVRARRVGQVSVLYSTMFGIALAVIFAAGFQVIPGIFTSDEGVLQEISGPRWQLVLMIVLGGVVFAFDGVLLGAADAAYLRTVSLLSVLVGFLPGVWLALLFNAGLVGVWWGLVSFISIRMIAGVWRFYSMKWAYSKDL
ncbi:MATE family efflux transporter [Corynebacterium pseudotuberculosis]|uniref:MATE family efflux transporter n=1 Tax=Corynebacterium pseudotuberculosis (strain C231) TaxID=681645 RepID=D9QB21_CORP2|nr:MATE family efflux transporter [Corynebacterium pseudotuberculosis]ADK29071.1 MATE family efflux transporter [Corynebacterium pseudotuberculosis FRC41]ADL10747.1 MATE family efflux transporter [Corynebacterium pseudotuberculosis C231]ADL21155.1 MATE family efflux transporter [Corynebacterium pseudotuberculosis 1002]AFH52229.1 Multidrug resistance protein norM [Corynebacterium pseudotuberculosis 267]AJC14016.1 Multidrug resistance protein [Corynebacterium pseudotuberculosis]